MKNRLQFSGKVFITYDDSTVSNKSNKTASGNALVEENANLRNEVKDLQNNIVRMTSAEAQMTSEMINLRKKINEYEQRDFDIRLSYDNIFNIIRAYIAKDEFIDADFVKSILYTTIMSTVHSINMIEETPSVSFLEVIDSSVALINNIINKIVMDNFEHGRIVRMLDTPIDNIFSVFGMLNSQKYKDLKDFIKRMANIER